MGEWRRQQIWLLVSFNIRRIQKLASHPLKVKPAVNQVELSYWLPQPELLQVCEYTYYYYPVLNDTFHNDSGQKITTCSLRHILLLVARRKLKKALKFPRQVNHITIILINPLTFLQSTYVGQEHCQRTWNNTCSGIYFLACSTRSKLMSVRCCRSSPLLSSWG